MTGGSVVSGAPSLVLTLGTSRGTAGAGREADQTQGILKVWIVVSLRLLVTTKDWRAPEQPPLLKPSRLLCNLVLPPPTLPCRGSKDGSHLPSLLQDHRLALFC